MPTGDPSPPEWSPQRGVPEVGHPARPAAPEAPDIQAPENVHRRRYLLPAPVPTISLEPMHDCPGYLGPERLTAVGATTQGGGSVTVTWYDPNDADTRSYRVVTFPVEAGVDPVMSYTPVAAPHRCVQMTATVTGLKVGGRYEFWLEAVNSDPLNRNRLSNRTVGRSVPVTVS